MTGTPKNDAPKPLDEKKPVPPPYTPKLPKISALEAFQRAQRTCGAD